MSWYEVVLSSEQLSGGVSEKIQSDFEALFVKAGTPPEMALFCDTFPVPL
jgi:ketol-acid reductoisomerase